MYNDVYTAIKKVRPDALVGGPYVSFSAYAAPRPGNLASTPHGAWGYLDQRALDALSFWLAHKAGADFLAVDGLDLPVSGPITEPLTATKEFAVVDRWLRRRTSLPIWWMESGLQPINSGWSTRRAAAIRVAALVRFASSHARVDLQWQPQDGEGIPDEGLWTSTAFPSGGQPTVLARVLPRVLTVLIQPIALVSGQRSGVLVARGPGGTIAVNTTVATVTALINKRLVTLGPGQVRVTLRAHAHDAMVRG